MNGQPTGVPCTSLHKMHGHHHSTVYILTKPLPQEVAAAAEDNEGDAAAVAANDPTKVQSLEALQQIERHLRTMGGQR